MRKNVKKRFIKIGLAVGMCFTILGGIFSHINISKASKIDKENIKIDFEINTTSAENMSEHLVNDATFESNYFSNVSTEYNHNLAILSLQMAMCASSTAESDVKYGEILNKISKVKDKKIDYSKSRNGYLTKAYKDMGFYKDVYYKYEKPLNDTTDTAAYGIASRKIYVNNKEYNLVSVAVRSNGYGAEWASNFMVKDENGNTGFHTAAIEVYKNIKKYIKDNKLGSNTKIWISGFSRGAAIANITGAYLDKNVKETKIARDNIYVYGFATPQGAYDVDGEEVSKELYNNIITVVNESDVVPMVAPSKWGYHRYGKVYTIPSIYIPSKVTSKIESGEKVNYDGLSADSIALAKKVSRDYCEIRFLNDPKTYEERKDELYVGFNVNPKLKYVLDDIFEIFANNSNEYSAKWQDIFTDLMGYAIGQTKKYDEVTKQWVTYDNLKEYIEDNGPEDMMEIAEKKGVYSKEDYDKQVKILQNMTLCNKKIMPGLVLNVKVDNGTTDNIKFLMDNYYAVRIMAAYYGIGQSEIKDVSGKLLDNIGNIVKTTMPFSEAASFKKNHYGDFYLAYLQNYNPATGEVLVDLN